MIDSVPDIASGWLSADMYSIPRLHTNGWVWELALQIWNIGPYPPLRAELSIKSGSKTIFRDNRPTNLNKARTIVQRQVGLWCIRDEVSLYNGIE